MLKKITLDPLRSQTFHDKETVDEDLSWYLPYIWDLPDQWAILGKVSDGVASAIVRRRGRAKRAPSQMPGFPFDIFHEPFCNFYSWNLPSCWACESISVLFSKSLSEIIFVSCKQWYNRRLKYVQKIKQATDYVNDQQIYRIQSRTRLFCTMIS